jgi:uroporphyrinogen III methyltransferase/synthase
LAGYDWIIFTSANGVAAFMPHLFGTGQDVRALGRAKIAAIGPATAAALRPYGLIPDVVPNSFVAEDLAAALAPHMRPGVKVLLARAQVAREVLPESLARMGAEVTVVPVYKAQAPQALPSEAEAVLREGRVDVLTFASSATVHNFVALVGKERFQALAAQAVAAAIGPITAAALQEYGVTPQIQPETYTIPALAAAVIGYFDKG